MPGHFISCLHGQTLWHSLVGDVILLPLHIPARTERQDPLSVCFLNLGNSRILLPCNTQAGSFIKSCPGKCFIHSCSRPTVGKARAFKPWELEDNGGVLGSSFPAALATFMDARERTKRCSSLLVSGAKESFAYNVDAKSSGPEQGSYVPRRGLAWSHVLHESKAFCLKSSVVERETENGGILLSFRAELVSSPTECYTECPPCTPRPGH